MKKKNLFLLLMVLIAVAASAQIKPIKNMGQPIIRCYTTESVNIGRKQNPNAETDAHFENWLKIKMLERETDNLQVKPYVLPIIFHVLYDGEGEGNGSNLSQALIQQQILQLNKDYANQSNSPYAVAAATGIQFVLAQKDPNGKVLPEPGIERIDRNSKGWQALGAKGWSRDYIAATIKPQTIWDPERYINVWLVPAMNNGGASKLLGFSTFPVSSTLDGLNADPVESNTIAGVVIDHATVGSIFRPQTCNQGWGKGKTLSHELGHYFGLRHTWGDSKCGNDYVDDTPVQEDANYGSPIHPKPDACGTADEMFENYMDYTDDELLNTFTADQVNRMQTVLLYSPRRTNLPNSNVGFVTVTGSNKISFAGCTGEITTTETGTTGTYPRYKDISLTLNVDYAASAAATVTLIANGTASSSQYQLLTPTVTFAKGDAFKPVVIRLFDNAAVDGDRSLNVSYTISGTGVAADTASQSITITENDDDNIAFAGDSVVNIIDEHFETVPAGSLVPQGWGSYVASGYPNLFVAGSHGNAGGSGKAAYITNNKTTQPNTYTKGLSGAAELLSPQINPLLYRSLDSLKFKYSVRGSADDHGYVVYDVGDGSLYFWGGQGLTGSSPYYGTNATQSASLSLPVPADVLNKKFNIAFYWETDTAKNGGDPGLNIDDVSLSGEPYSIETAVSSSFGYDVQPNFINKFRSANNKIVADIDSVSADVKNVTASVSEAGNDTATLSLNGSSIGRTRKVMVIKPAAESATTYTATFYFTAAEMAVWGAKAGNLSILKVKNGASLTSPLSSSDAVVIKPGFVDNRLSTQGFITYTATVTGFGQFMLIDSAANNALPAFTWVSFTGALTGNTIALDWKTANENKELPFEVERSTDSVSFTKIGSVAANNKALNEYTYNDKNISKGNKYFYRIKQTDSSGNTSYSIIIGINYPTDTTIIAQWIKVYPNPMKDKLLLDFGNTSSQSVNIMIADMAGRIVYNTTSTVQGHKEITTANLSRAIYIVKVQTTDRVVTFEIMKK